MANELAFFGFMSLDMVMGMALGMIASPLLMKAIKVMRNRRKINRLLKDIADARKNAINNSDMLSE